MLIPMPNGPLGRWLNSSDFKSLMNAPVTWLMTTDLAYSICAFVKNWSGAAVGAMAGRLALGDARAESDLQVFLAFRTLTPDVAVLIGRDGDRELIAEASQVAHSSNSFL